MSRNLKINVKIFLVLILAGTALFAFRSNDNSNKIGSKLSSVYNYYNSNETFLVWVTFSDKGTDVQSKIAHPENYLTKESIARRKKNNPADYFNYTDLPLNDEYVQSVLSSGAKINQRANWFNSISCNVTRDQLESIIKLSFVTKVELVAKFYKKEDDQELKVSNVVIPESHSVSKDSKTLLNYGSSLTQMQLINATTAQDSGFFGQGVIIASFDAGFNNLAHPCFDSIRARGLRTYDFINHDTIVADGTGRMGNGSHGTETLSLVCGYAPGNLISPAFRSRLILAKTENTDSETPAEEDNWIAAVQWADSLGADVITSSLGYVAMDPGSSHTYDWTWMSGDSTLITKGANLAITKGMIVCNSAGNSGTSTHNTLGAPSDGFKVICVGSVDSPSKQRSSFSSVGNTTRGALKPEVMALGSGNVVAQPYSGSGGFPTGYTSGSGTSFSCPMTAGVVAQLLSSNHNLTVDQVRTALFTTADSTNTPNRFRGYGIINSFNAIKKARTLTGVSDPSTIPVEFNLAQNFPNPFNPQTTINYQLAKEGFVRINIYDITGKNVQTLLNNQSTAGSFNITWNASSFATGIYFYTLEVNGVNVDTKKMMLIK